MTQPSYDHYKEGITSLLEASEDYELAPLGISSLQKQAEKLAEFGRNGDIYVVHAAEGETVVPMEVLDANPQIKSLLFNQMEEMGLDPNRYVVGNEFNSLNPVTGMPEFFLKKIFKSAKKVFKKVKKLVKKIAPIAIPIAASFFGIPFLGPVFGAGTIGAAALGSGIGTLVGGGSLKDALKSAAIGGGMAGLGGFLKGGTAGLKASFTGQTPIYNAAGELIGTQAAATPSQVWGSLTGDAGVVSGAQKAVSGYSGDFNPVKGYDPASSALHGTGIDPATNLPYGSVRYNPTGAPGPAENLWNKLKPASSPDAGVSTGTDSGNYFGTRWKFSDPGTFEMGKDYANAGMILSDGPKVVSAPVQAAEYINPITKMPVTSAAEYKQLVTAGLLPPGPHLAPPAKPLLGSLSPTQYAGKLLGAEKVTPLAANVGDLALAGGATYLAGGFEQAPEEDPRETADAARDVFDPIVIDPVLAEQSEIDVSTQIPTSTAEELLQPTLFSADGGSVQKMAVGGYPRRELLVEGPGTERSDDIPAMLSDGEFVINSKAVRGADPSGRGNRYAGAQNLYNIMRNFEMRA
jgi:hypothetical protein